jgi:hypothetical protein
MTNQERILGTVCNAHRYALNIAREEKPTGDWPCWVDAMDAQLNPIERQLRKEAKESR